MKCLCEKNTIYGIIKNDKLQRLTFSKSLAEHICSYENNLTVKKMSFILGKKLEFNENSKTGLYAIVKSKNNWTLRVTLFKELANTWNSHSSREIFECFIV